MTPQRFSALYTKKLTQKTKTWHDCILLVTDKKSEIRSDDGSLLATSSTPAGLRLSADCEETLTCFEGFLVQITGACEDEIALAPAQLQQDEPAQQSTGFKPAAARPALANVQVQHVGAVPIKRSSTGFQAYRPPRRAETQATAPQPAQHVHNHSARLEPISTTLGHIPIPPPQPTQRGMHHRWHSDDNHPAQGHQPLTSQPWKCDHQSAHTNQLPANQAWKSGPSMHATGHQFDQRWEQDHNHHMHTTQAAHEIQLSQPWGPNHTSASLGMGSILAGPGVLASPTSLPLSTGLPTPGITSTTGAWQRQIVQQTAQPLSAWKRQLGSEPGVSADVLGHQQGMPTGNLSSSNIHATNDNKMNPQAASLLAWIFNDTQPPPAPQTVPVATTAEEGGDKLNMGRASVQIPAVQDTPQTLQQPREGCQTLWTPGLHHEQEQHPQQLAQQCTEQTAGQEAATRTGCSTWGLRTSSSEGGTGRPAISNYWDKSAVNGGVDLEVHAWGAALSEDGAAGAVCLGSGAGAEGWSDQGPVAACNGQSPTVAEGAWLPQPLQCSVMLDMEQSPARPDSLRWQRQPPAAQLPQQHMGEWAHKTWDARGMASVAGVTDRQQQGADGCEQGADMPPYTPKTHGNAMMGGPLQQHLSICPTPSQAPAASKPPHRIDMGHAAELSAAAGARGLNADRVGGPSWQAPGSGQDAAEPDAKPAHDRITSTRPTTTVCPVLVPRYAFSAPVHKLLPRVPAGDGALSALTFPNVHTAGPSGGGSAVAAVRLATIPTASVNPSTHMLAVQAALVEEVNLRVAEAAQPLIKQMLSALLTPITRSAGVVRAGTECGQVPVAGGFALPGARVGTGGVQQLRGGALGKAVMEGCDRAHIPYFAGAQLKVCTPWVDKGSSRGGRGAHGKGRGGRSGRWGSRGGGDDDDDDDDDEDVNEEGDGGGVSSKRCWLTIPDVRSKIKEFRKFDLWFLSTHPLLTGNGTPLLLAVRSLWHAPDQNCKMMVELLTGNLPNRQDSLYAWRSPDVSSELHVIQALAGATTTGRAACIAGSMAAANNMPALFHHLVKPSMATYTLWDVCGAAARGDGEADAAKLMPAFKKPRLHAGQLSAVAAAVTIGKGGRGGVGDVDTGADGDGGNGGGGGEWVHKEMSARTVLAELVNKKVHEFKLNHDQQSVMRHVASWLLQEVEKEEGAEANTASAVQSPVCLVHGPFGSGKSTLLAALIMMLVEARGELCKVPDDMSKVECATGKKAAKTAKHKPSATGPRALLAAHCRVLVAANTNVAVDRVLMALEERGFTSFLRVGSLPRINRAVLPRSIHATDDSKDAKLQLKAMIRNESDELERRLLDAELAAINAGAEKTRRKALASMPVVGTTCAALLQSDLWQQAGQFPIVVLDESSQMTEPASLIPIIKAKASFLIAAGDPMQLPPVLSKPPHVTLINQQPQSSLGLLGQQGNSNNNTGDVHGLLRPLFVRLQHLGHSAHLLRTQYRCHPSISLMPNAMFYEGRLVDGCSAKARGPIARLGGVSMEAGSDQTGRQGGVGGTGSDRKARTMHEDYVTGNEDNHENHGDGMEEDHKDNDDGGSGSVGQGSKGLPGDVGLPALCFCNILDGDTQIDDRSRSSFNWREARSVSDLVMALQQSGVSPDDIGVICFYKAQVSKIQGLIAQRGNVQGDARGQGQGEHVGLDFSANPSLRSEKGDDDTARHAGDDGDDGAQVKGGPRSKGQSKVVQVATVDSYQGAEKEVIILATTITRVNQSAFVSDPNRLNVALTRARRHLLVVGAANVLSHLPDTKAFAKIITLCKQAGQPSSTTQHPHPPLQHLPAGMPGTASHDMMMIRDDGADGGTSTLDSDKNDSVSAGFYQSQQVLLRLLNGQ